jgi:TetR/AcrR family transcriptional regulator
MAISSTKDQATEERIFDAAQAVFLESGFDGARMKEIAGRADINHSMLHYYFRTKGQLFDAVFRRAAMEFMPSLVDVLRSSMPLLEKIDLFVIRYLETIKANPHMPGFIIQELRRNPDALKEIAGSVGGNVIDILRADIYDAVATGLIRRVTPEDLFANLVGLCVWPFIARPMLETIFEAGGSDFETFLDERRDSVRSFMRHALAP